MMKEHENIERTWKADADFVNPTQESIWKVTRQLKKEQCSLYNCVASVLSDAAFVSEVKTLYPNTPLLANLRCGLWYTRHADSTCYFKSTDGHNGNWSFSCTRLNWHVCEMAAKRGGVIIVDATRKGKRFPDAMTKTIPIWSAVINRAVARKRAEAEEKQAQALRDAEGAASAATAATLAEATAVQHAAVSPQQPDPFSCARAPASAGDGTADAAASENPLSMADPDGAPLASSFCFYEGRRSSSSTFIPSAPSAPYLTPSSMSGSPEAEGCARVGSLSQWLNSPTSLANWEATRSRVIRPGSPRVMAMSVPPLSCSTEDAGKAGAKMDAREADGAEVEEAPASADLAALVQDSAGGVSEEVLRLCGAEAWRYGALCGAAAVDCRDDGQGAAVAVALLDVRGLLELGCPRADSGWEVPGAAGRDEGPGPVRDGATPGSAGLCAAPLPQELLELLRSGAVAEVGSWPADVPVPPVRPSSPKLAMAEALASADNDEVAASSADAVPCVRFGVMTVCSPGANSDRPCVLGDGLGSSMTGAAVGGCCADGPGDAGQAAAAVQDAEVGVDLAAASAAHVSCSPELGWPRAGLGCTAGGGSGDGKSCPCVLMPAVSEGELQEKQQRQWQSLQSPAALQGLANNLYGVYDGYGSADSVQQQAPFTNGMHRPLLRHSPPQACPAQSQRDRRCRRRQDSEGDADGEEDDGELCSVQARSLLQVCVRSGSSSSSSSSSSSCVSRANSCSSDQSDEPHCTSASGSCNYFSRPASASELDQADGEGCGEATSPASRTFPTSTCVVSAASAFAPLAAVPAPGAGDPPGPGPGCSASTSTGVGGSSVSPSTCSRDATTLRGKRSAPSSASGSACDCSQGSGSAAGTPAASGGPCACGGWGGFRTCGPCRRPAGAGGGARGGNPVRSHHSGACSGAAAAAAAATADAQAATAAGGDVGLNEWDVSLHLPLWISSNERAQIERRLDGWVDALLKVGADVEGLAKVLHKPLRPLWISQSSTIWVDQVAQPDQLPFTPLYLVSASQPHSYLRQAAACVSSVATGSDADADLQDSDVAESHHRARERALTGADTGADADSSEGAAGKAAQRYRYHRRQRPHQQQQQQQQRGRKTRPPQGPAHEPHACTYVYVPGAGDDEESWAAGLTPAVFWAHYPRLLQAGPAGVHEVVRQLLQQEAAELAERGTNSSVVAASGGADAAAASAAVTPAASSPFAAGSGDSTPGPLGTLVGSSSSAAFAAPTDQHHLLPAGYRAAGGASGAATGPGPCGMYSLGLTRIVLGDLTTGAAPACWEHVDAVLSCGTTPHPSMLGEPQWPLRGPSVAASPAGSPRVSVSGTALQGEAAAGVAGLGNDGAVVSCCIEEVAPAVAANGAAGLPTATEHPAHPAHAVEASVGHHRSHQHHYHHHHSSHRPHREADAAGDPAGAEHQRSSPSRGASRHHKPRYLHLPVQHFKHSRTCLAEQLQPALRFLSHHLSRGRTVLIHDTNGLDTCVCVAVALLLACYGTGGPSGEGGTGAPEWAHSYRPAGLGQAVGVDHVSKDAVRQRLAFVGAWYPLARPTRGMLRQVFNHFVSPRFGSVEGTNGGGVGTGLPGDRRSMDGADN